MALSWRVIVASSASLSSSRARWATQRTCSAVRDMASRRQLGRLALGRPLHEAAADALDADALGLGGAARLHPDALEVGAEGPLADAGDLAADAAQVLGLAAPRVLVAAGRLLAADRTLHAHDSARPLLSDGRTARPRVRCRKCLV